MAQREFISWMVIGGGSFEVHVDTYSDLRRKQPERTESIRGVIDVAQGGYQVKMITKVGRQPPETQFIGDCSETYAAAYPSLTGAFLGILASHETSDGLLGYLDITVKSKTEKEKA